ncbi:tripeptidyl peptidase I precursor [Planoprotostelium fungivorum]|uniref:Tripeptidyl peptidase I n=1 Tax=Planoprotostelium fungivorum TaxID=1890364 RepID=A0A2P6NQQ4_9EUKA|nr:tripeptidyl peptidase I precursor [Planoprotostelium fungivorum]
MWKTLCFAILCIVLVSGFGGLKRPSSVTARTFAPRTTHKWTPSTLPSRHHTRDYFIALRERNLDQVERLAIDISDPESSSYSQHLTFEQLNGLTSPHDEDIQRVTRWLQAHSIEHEVLPAKTYIRVRATTRQIESLLRTKLRTFSHSESDKPIVRAESAYYVPTELDDVIHFIAPLHGYPRVARRGPIRKVTPSGKRSTALDAVTPDIIRTRYNITAPLIDLKVNNTQAVFEIQGDISDDDLQSFYQQFAPKLAGQKVRKFLGDGGNAQTQVGTESSLDIEYIAALGGFAPNYYYNYNVRDKMEGKGLTRGKENDIYSAFLKYATDLINDPKPPLVQSISYGNYGGDYPIEEVDRISDEFMKLGARGVTVLVASGDDGVGCNTFGTSFEFPYPSTPWVTLVGSTSLQTESDGTYTEVGSTFSTGGFSGDFATPKWQKEAVEEFLKNPDLPAASYYNASGRALPDISTVGESFQIVVGGDVASVDGTSCSAPTFGGMVSIINGLRLKAGKKPVGFINPLLYKAATVTQGRAYYDVTSGNNGDWLCPGFDAVKGWDPVTGLGTPNFDVLGKYAVSLP